MAPPDLETDATGPNLLPFASMAGGWLGPLLLFWLYVWGPLRPFDYPQDNLAPSAATFTGALLLCVAVWWLPAAYYRIRPFERDGRLYEALGVRWFRRFVPDGDLANRWRRRHHSSFRVIPNRQAAERFVRRTELSEKSHLVLLLMGILSTAFAWEIGWRGWAWYLGTGNLAVNLYPVLLQRYTRARLHAVLGG